MPALYDAASLPQLEAKVEAQCTGGSYDLDNNLAVLKLYQFYPEKSNTAVIAKVLVQALMRLPETDYLMCKYLIPDRVVSDHRRALPPAAAPCLSSATHRGAGPWPRTGRPPIRGAQQLTDATRPALLCYSKRSPSLPTSASLPRCWRHARSGVCGKRCAAPTPSPTAARPIRLRESRASPSPRAHRRTPPPSLAQLEPLEADVLKHVPGFADAVREFALHTMQMTCVHAHAILYIYT